MLVHFLLPLRWRFCTPAHCDLWCWRRPTARVDFYPQLPCPDPVDVKITSVAPFCALSAVVPGTGKNTINIYYLSILPISSFHSLPHPLWIDFWPHCFIKAGLTVIRLRSAVELIVVCQSQFPCFQVVTVKMQPLREAGQWVHGTSLYYTMKW